MFALIQIHPGLSGGPEGHLAVARGGRIRDREPALLRTRGEAYALRRAGQRGHLERILLLFAELTGPAHGAHRAQVRVRRTTRAERGGGAQGAPVRAGRHRHRAARGRELEARGGDRGARNRARREAGGHHGAPGGRGAAAGT